MSRSNVLVHGKARRLGGGQRSWRAHLDAPSDKYRSYRVRFKEQTETGEWKWTTRNAETEDEARALLAQVEAALDAHTPVPARAKETAVRTVAALGDLYLQDSRKRNLAVRTVENRESRLRAHIKPAVGDLPVAQWRVEHTEEVLAAATATVHSPSGLGDIRTDLSVMRKLAWRNGWLDRSIDPLDGVTTPKVDRQQGAEDGYVPPEMRPETHQVDAMARAADHLSAHGEGINERVCRLPGMGTMTRVGGYGGLRSGEQFGLRAVDLFLSDGWVYVNGSWTQPRAEDSGPFRGPVKNRTLHEVPLPRSVLSELVPLAARAMGLPVTATQKQVENAIIGERRRRTTAARALGDRKVFWWNLPVDPADECWLFIDTTTGLPPRSEFHNEMWHKVRRWVAANDPEHEWPDCITYRNLRHHAATFWHNELEEDWAVVAQYLGDKLTTVLKHYVRAGVDALSDTVDKLENR